VLTVVHSPNGAAVWDRALSAWRADATAKLIVSGPLVRHRVLAAEVARRGTLLGGTVDTMERLWRDVGSRAEIPPPLDDVELRAQVVDALADDSIPPRLAAVAERQGDVDRLVAHLKDLDDRVADDYPAQTPIEGGIADLRQVLADRGVVSRARFRVLTARAAHGMAYGQPLLIAPPSAIRSTTGHLLMGLAEMCEVTLFLACPGSDLPLLLTQLGIDPAHVTLTPLEAPTPTPDQRLIEADDEVEVAVEQAAKIGRAHV